MWVLIGAITNIAIADDDGSDGYTLSLKELIRQSQENIEKVDAEIENQKIAKENEERESLARAYFQKGNALYKQGKLKEARDQWQKALDLTNHPEMKDYIRQSDNKAKEQMKAEKVKTMDDAQEVSRGYDLNVLNKDAQKKKSDKITTQEKPKTKKKTVTKKEKSTKMPKTVAKPKTETPEIERGCVFQGSSMVINDVKETQDKPRPAVKKKGTKVEPNSKTSQKRWWQRDKKDETKEQKSEDKAVKQGCTFQGSSLIVNEVKEEKKEKPKVKKSYPKVKTTPTTRKISKPKLQKEEKQPAEKGYDIFLK